MVGVTYSNIKPGETCYIVVNTPDNQPEYLEGKFVGVLPEGHSAWKRVKTKGLPYHGRSYAKPVQAVITDPALGRRGMDPLTLGQEPFRDYEVISRREYVARIRREVEGLKREVATAQNLARITTEESNARIKTITDDLTAKIIRTTRQYAVNTDHLLTNIRAMEKDARRKPLAYLAIGVAFSVAACLGVAAYQNYVQQSRLPETKTLEIRVEQP